MMSQGFTRVKKTSKLSVAEGLVINSVELIVQRIVDEGVGRAGIIDILAVRWKTLSPAPSGDASALATWMDRGLKQPASIFHQRPRCGFQPM